MNIDLVGGFYGNLEVFRNWRSSISFRGEHSLFGLMLVPGVSLVSIFLSEFLN